MAASCFTRFDIEFRQKDAVYRPGDLLTGQVLIQLNKPLTLKAIRIQFKGRSSWAADAKKGAEIEQVYFDRQFVLLERPPGRGPGLFPWHADRLYTLPFECPLPKSCITSYEGAKAFTRYFCLVTVEQGEPESNVFIRKRPFTILASPPQTIDQGLMQPVAAQEALTVGSFCCRGKLTAELTLTKACYLPGELVYGSISINNRQSRQILEPVQCRLVDQTRNVQSKQLGPTRVLVEKTLDNVQPKGTLTRDSLALIQIPALAPSTQPAENNNADALFHVEYAIEVVCGPKLSVTLPVTVGNVPLCLKDNWPQPTSYKEFGPGPQNIAEESDGKAKVVGSMLFAPVYPVFESPTSLPEDRHTNGAA